MKLEVSIIIWTRVYYGKRVTMVMGEEIALVTGEGGYRGMWGSYFVPLILPMSRNSVI